MKAITVDPGRRTVQLVERDEPPPPERDEVLLRILDVGICGTDREIMDFEYGTPPSGSAELVLGHEALAEVVAAGGDVDDLAAGDLVVPMVRRPCDEPRCVPCRNGRQDYCTTGSYTERGIKELDGFMTELVVDERRWLHPVPRELRDVGVLVEPLTIAQKALAQVWALQQRLVWGEEPGTGQGLTAVVLGAGPVGLLGAMALQTAGFRTVVYSRTPAPNDRADLAEAIGAPYYSSDELTGTELTAEIGPIDLCYEAAGVSHAAFDLMGHMAPNAVFVLTGVPGDEADKTMETDTLMRAIVLGNQAVLGTVNAGASDFTAAISNLVEFQRRWPGPLRSLVTGRHPLERYDDVLQGRTGGIKDVLSVTA